VCQQCPLDFYRQPIGLFDDDWSYSFATGHWRVDIGAEFSDIGPNHRIWPKDIVVVNSDTI
jgi:hypothetical protein